MPQKVQGAFKRGCFKRGSKREQEIRSQSFGRASLLTPSPCTLIRAAQTWNDLIIAAWHNSAHVPQLLKLGQT
jgi:hypothetical protein